MTHIPYPLTTYAIRSASAGLRPPWACTECPPGFFFEHGVAGATSREEACPLSCVRNSSLFDWYPRRYREGPPGSLAASCDNKTVLCDLPGEGRPELPLSYGGTLKDGGGNEFRKRVDGLDGAYSVATSPDGTAVYVAGSRDNALSWFAVPSCAPCPRGHSCPQDGSDTMLICEKGTVQDVTRQTSCTTCDRGSYQDAKGQFFCKACARGKVGL